MNLYASRLSKENIEDVVNGLHKIGQMAREEFEPALPDIGTILAVVGAEKVSRQNRIAAANDKDFVAFKCPACGATCSGWLLRTDQEPRLCRGIPKRPHQSGEHCGEVLNEIHRERA
jgi:hypothetical protein